jgi:hypothetical protein
LFVVPPVFISRRSQLLPVAYTLKSVSVNLAKGDTAAANCAKSFVTREGFEKAFKRYVVPKVGLPWPEWIKT